MADRALSTGCAVVAALALVQFSTQAHAGAGRWPRAVEKPPEIYASGPTLTGKTTERYFSDPFALDAFCAAHLGREPKGSYYQACYVAALDLVVLPNEKAWPSRVEREALRIHEWAHARSWRHLPNGRGTDWACSAMPRGLIEALAGRVSIGTEPANPAPVFMGGALPADAPSSWRAIAALASTTQSHRPRDGAMP